MLVLFFFKIEDLGICCSWMILLFPFIRGSFVRYGLSVPVSNAIFAQSQGKNPIKNRSKLSSIQKPDQEISVSVLTIAVPAAGPTVPVFASSRLVPTASAPLLILSCNRASNLSAALKSKLAVRIPGDSTGSALMVSVLKPLAPCCRSNTRTNHASPRHGTRYVACK